LPESGFPSGSLGTRKDLKTSKRKEFVANTIGSVGCALRTMSLYQLRAQRPAPLIWCQRLSSLYQSIGVVVHSLERLCHQPIPVFFLVPKYNLGTRVIPEAAIPRFQLATDY
jgi:hypothetical protein